MWNWNQGFKRDKHLTLCASSTEHITLRKQSCFGASKKVSEIISISKGISAPETISFRSSFVRPETMSFGLIPKPQVSAGLKLIGPPGTVRPGQLKAIVSGTLPKLIVSVHNKLLLKPLVSGTLIPLPILIVSETFLGPPKQLYFRSVTLFVKRCLPEAF
jgi:hypothetical protein